MYVNQSKPASEWPRSREEADLVILPGLLCDGRMFERQLATFGGIVIEGFYGHADRIEAMAEYALERMPFRANLLGHSMGARVAIEICRRAPGRVVRLALADTGVHGVRRGEAEKRYALRDLGRRQGQAALVDAWLPPMLGPNRRTDAALRAMLEAMAIDAGLAAFERQIEALLNRPDAAAVLPLITSPTFAIVGRDDIWSPVDQHQEIVAAIPGAQLRVLDGVGHMAPAENPTLFNEVLGEWLLWPAPQNTGQQIITRNSPR